LTTIHILFDNDSELDGFCVNYTQCNVDGQIKCAALPAYTNAQTRTALDAVDVVGTVASKRIIF